MPRSAYLLDLALTDYRSAYELQLDAVAARHEGRLDRDVVILLEHSPVFTLGRRGGRENIIVSEDLLRERGIEVVPIERGGDVTYHGPGQLVAYVIMDLKPSRISATQFVSAMENAMVLTAGHWGVRASGNSAFRGAWVGSKKLGSLGITIRRGITFHGLAMNINTDLAPFAWINPCGIQGCAMTSLAQELGKPLPMETVRRRMASHLSNLLGLSTTSISYRALKTRI